VFELVDHGPDTFIGSGPQYPWGGLYGGQIVAQAVRAASHTVDSGFQLHSVRAYFIRRGDHTEPVRYEVDRIRNGRSFVTRRVVARQAVGAILNAECSFQLPVAGAVVAPVTMPEVPHPRDLVEDSWSTVFARALVPDIAPAAVGAGRSAGWFKVIEEIGPPESNWSMHQCWLAYLSDDMPTDAVRLAHPQASVDGEHFFGTSLDHTIWFHQPMRADRWHLHDFSCHHFIGERGLSIGHIFSENGDHVATVAQEVLLRDRRQAPSG